MSAFQALKSACRATTVFKNFDQIKIGVYDVIEFKFVETRFGKKVAVVTEDFLCILPERFSTTIRTDAAIEELNETRYIMKYKGKDAGQHNRVMLDFEVYPQPPQNAQEWTFEDLIGLPSTSELSEIMKNKK